MKSYSISSDANQRAVTLTPNAFRWPSSGPRPGQAPTVEYGLPRHPRVAPHGSRATHREAETCNRRKLQLEMAATPRKQTTGQILIDTNFGSRRPRRAPQISNHKSRITNHQSLLTNHYKRHVCLPPPTLLK